MKIVAWNGNNTALQETLPSELQMSLYIDKEKDIELEEKKENEMNSLDVEEIKKEAKKFWEYVSDKDLDECVSYLKYFEVNVIKHALFITKKAQNPCWNYTKKVLETYKSKKLYTLDLLLNYEEKRIMPKCIAKTKYAFMDDSHSKEEWEELYDN